MRRNAENRDARARKKTQIQTGRQRLGRALRAYTLLTVVTFLVDKIYALFAHGVGSDYMRYLFLLPLLGGVAVFLLIALLLPRLALRKSWRIAFNLYNSGIAAISASWLLKGILEIAGADSRRPDIFFYVGIGFVALGILVVIIQGIASRAR